MLNKLITYVKKIFQKKEYIDVPIIVRFGGLEINNRNLYAKKEQILEFYKFLLRHKIAKVEKFDKQGADCINLVIRDFVIGYENLGGDVKIFNKVR